MAPGDTLGRDPLPRYPGPPRQLELAASNSLRQTLAAPFDLFNAEAFEAGVREIPFTVKLKKISKASN